MTHRVDDMPLPVWLPESGSGPGIVLIQEIFGLDGYLRGVAEKLAALGYVVAVPELFHRFQPGWVGEHDEAGIAKSMEVVGSLDFPLAVQDVVASLQYLRGLPEVTGGVGVLGFCLGGTLAYSAAVASDPDTAVSFYGSGVPDQVGTLDQVSCPILFHFGTEDSFITGYQKVVDAVAAHEGAEIHLEPAGHAFLNHLGPWYDEEAAGRAWDLTAAFLARTLPA
ncbi:dienelactone hydrolase family protein [Lentzea aerocolonigenes]|uniref:dienelactone hydrolase family protein n=1 Tax=Lentzea aerocolonigenes TaxID=68170 RepID=UPI0004C3DC4C|nr:dienelactone hydrolase family protein [Lentzea aerocolonigenes]MCP2245127.1 carboxymethylenebutenolidase [Lentzea aerocolonigenes]